MAEIKAKMQMKATERKSLDNCFIFADGFSSFNSSEYTVFPGFCDVHVHFREPGFSYKETVASGSLAAAAGGYTDVCTMPNLDPVPDSVEHLSEQLDIIRRDAVIGVHPYGAITVGEKGEQIADLEGMAKDVIGFSDDGRGVQSDEMMREAMQRAKKLGKMIVAHCEVNDLLRGGYIHDGEYAQAHGHRGICSESEWRQIERDLKLVKEIGCDYHVCHISTKETVELVRQAKRRGVKVTCETGPHYLIFTDMDLEEDARWKMNPPIRSAEDRAALIEGIKDGTIDMIATDHAPHSIEEKSKGLKDSAMGIVGLETAFAALNTHLVNKGIITLQRLVELMSINPRKVFRIEGGINPGDRADIVLLDLDKEWRVDSSKFYSQGKVTMFDGRELKGDIRMTIHHGNVVYEDNNK